MICPECGKDLLQIAFDGYYCLNCRKKVKALINQPPKDNEGITEKVIQEAFKLYQMKKLMEFLYQGLKNE